MQLVSWSELIGGLAVTGLLWYGSVMLLYYRGTVQKLFSGFRQSVEKPSGMVIRHESAKVATEIHEPNDNDFTKVHELLEELKIALAQMASHPPQKADALQAIGLRLQQSGLRTSSLRDSINQYIVNEYPLPDTLTIEEINTLW